MISFKRSLNIMFVSISGVGITLWLIGQRPERGGQRGTFAYYCDNSVAKKALFRISIFKLYDELPLCVKNSALDTHPT